MLRSAAYILVLPLLLAGCSHGFGPFGAVEQGAAGSASDAQSAIAEAQQQLEQSLAAGAQPDPALPHDLSLEPSAEEFADLFERMRAGFALPPVEDARVQRQIDWYLAHPQHLDRTLERGRRYLHHIVEQLEERNMPRELALLPVIESAFDPFANSPRRASGLWQFIPSTGRIYGLEQNWWMDGRRDVLAATRAALDHLEDLHEEFDGDWLLALASYNAGTGKVRRTMERNRRAGRPTDFFHLDLLPETRAYVPKLLALAQLASEPERFDLELPEIPNTPYFARVDVGGQIDLGRVADLSGIPLEELRALNPEFKRWATAPDGPHELLVPAPAIEHVRDVLATLPPSERLHFARHRVRRGDTLYAIARRYGVSIEALRDVNRVRGSLIRPGQDLLVPIPAGTTAAAHPRSRSDRDS